MNLVYMSKVDSRCNATLQIQSCTIRTALVRYSVAIEKGAIALDLRSPPEYIKSHPSLSDLVDTQDGLSAGSLAGLEYLGYYYLQSNGTISYDATEDLYWHEPGNGSTVNKYQSFLPSDIGPLCAFQWDNATDDILTSLHNARFRMANANSDGMSLLQS